MEVKNREMLKGGWPALLDVPLEEAVLLNRGYVDLLTDMR